MTVAPGPVFALVARRQLAEFAVGAMGFANPLAVLAHFVRIPDVVIIVVRIINADGGVAGAAGEQHRREKSGS